MKKLLCIFLEILSKQSAHDENNTNGKGNNQNDDGCTKWGHNNGDCIIEFVVDKNKWYSGDRGSHVNPGTSTCHPEWNQDIEKIVNKGNFFDLIKTDAAKFDNEDLLKSLEGQTLYEV